MLALIDVIRQTVGRWFATRRQSAESCTEMTTPNVDALIQAKYGEATKYGCYVLDAKRLLFEIQWNQEREVVCLVDRSCTCKEFDIEEIPCVHAIAATKMAKMNPASLVSKYYSTEYWNTAYEETIYPIVDHEHCEIPSCITSIECNPPIKRKRTGRLPKARIRGSMEGSKKKKCSCCGRVGHNKKTCRNQPMEKE